MKFESNAPIRLLGVIKNYEWGGKKAIPALIGAANPEDKPFAEYWIGAHPGSPSVTQLADSGRQFDLAQIIQQDPIAILGAEVTKQFGSLPYLLKILDAEKMLSIQNHPTEEAARVRYALENEKGIPPSAPHRNYKDSNPKPEVHVALTDFWMLHGFKPLAEIGAEFERVPALKEFAARNSFKKNVGDLASEIVSAANNPTECAGLVKKLYSHVMTLDQSEVTSILDQLIGDLPENEDELDKDAPDFWAVRAARHFPLPGGGRDRGIFSIYLLNLLHLKPGQGTYQAAGVLHAYLEGTTVELMANSDNVLRGGLTSKHVDVPELLGSVTLADGKAQMIQSKARSKTETVYATPARQFELSRIVITVAIPHMGAETYSAESFIVMEGTVKLKSTLGASFEFQKGEAFMIPAGMSYTLEGQSTLFKAAVPRPK